ncbi:MAG: ABC-F family ATP-binding cassette domain-containing protein [Euryarchaeota archaeon]|nr:ABC-F family ATP-binding cassette domain-containing protein [Euryarchaeota archaeon]
MPNIAPELLVRDVLAAPSPDAIRLEAEVRDLEAWMTAPDAWDAPDASERMARYGELQAALGEARSRSSVGNDPILSDLGVYEELLEQKFGALSGGEKSKVLLARALANAKEKDLLLLDEPTNHMDLATIEWIESCLMDLDASIVLASHDKFLLDNIAEKVLEVDRRKVFEYVGNYSDYRTQRDAIARAVEARKRRNFDEVKRQLAIIEDLKSRKRYTQVRSRKKEIARREAETAPTAPTASKAFRLVFGAAPKSGRSVLRVDGVSKRHSGRLLFDHVSFEIEKGDKIGLIGPNGCGKTTLLEILVGRQQPDAGSVDVSQTTKIGYFSQHHATMAFERTVYDEMRSIRDPPPPEDWVRGLLGRFWFRGDDVFKKVGQLSGGERARLSLAKFIAREHNLLVLDEPTNHLDIESQEIVSSALKEYPGSVLVVSHNRSFLNEIVNKIGVIAHREVAVFQGSFEDAWTAAKLGEFLGEKGLPRYRVLRVVRDWERGVSFQKGETIQLTGVETQAFRRLLRWAEGEGRIEQVAAR